MGIIGAQKIIDLAENQAIAEHENGFLDVVALELANEPEGETDKERTKGLMAELKPKIIIVGFHEGNAMNCAFNFLIGCRTCVNFVPLVWREWMKKRLGVGFCRAVAVGFFVIADVQELTRVNVGLLAGDADEFARIFPMTMVR